MQSPIKITFESWSPLHWAAFRGENDVIARLIRTHADRNARDSIGAMPLHCAVLGRTLNSNDLLARDREIFSFFQSPGGFSAENSVALENYGKAIEALVEGGAGINATDGLGLTACDWAGLMGDRYLQCLLERHGGRPGERGPSVARHAGAPARPFVLPAFGQDTFATWTPLHWAAQSGSAEEARRLIGSGADANAPDNLGQVALHIAVVFHSETNSALEEALRQDRQAWEESRRREQNEWRAGHPDWFVAPVFTEFWSPYETSLDLNDSRYCPVVETLGANGADINARSAAGWTPLDYANGLGDWRMARVIAKHGGRFAIAAPPKSEPESATGWFTRLRASCSEFRRHWMECLARALHPSGRGPTPRR